MYRFNQKYKIDTTKNRNNYTSTHIHFLRSVSNMFFYKYRYIKVVLASFSSSIRTEDGCVLWLSSFNIVYLWPHVDECPAFINVYFSHYKFNMTSRGKVYKNTAQGSSLYHWTYVVLMGEQQCGPLNKTQNLTVAAQNLTVVVNTQCIMHTNIKWFIVYFTMYQTYRNLMNHFLTCPFHCLDPNTASTLFNF